MENKRVFHIPKIRSMTDYINKNYRTAILEVLNDAIEEGTLRTKAGNRGIYLDIHNTDFYDIIYHQQGKDRVAADVLITVMDGNEICDKLWCELCIWFEDEVSMLRDGHLRGSTATKELLEQAPGNGLVF